MPYSDDDVFDDEADFELEAEVEAEESEPELEETDKPAAYRVVFTPGENGALIRTVEEI